MWTLAGNSPVYGPGWKFPLGVAQEVAGKPGLFLPGRTVYFCPFQPGVQDDALRVKGAEQVETPVRLRQIAKLFGVSTSGGWWEQKAVSP